MLRLDHLPHNPAQHFRLALYGVIAHLIEQCTAGDLDAAFGDQPFLADYHAELLAHPGALAPVAGPWREALARYEQTSAQRLPLLVLQSVGWSPLALQLLLACGLVEEDPRFGEVFAQAQGGLRRPTLALLCGWWRLAPEGQDRAEAVRHAVDQLVEGGLIETSPSDAPRLEWPLAVPHALWDTLRGDAPRAAWLQHRALAELPRLGALVLPPALRPRLQALPAMLASSPGFTLVLHGPAHNSRSTIAQALAQAAGHGVLWADAAEVAKPAPAALFETLALLLDAWPAVRCEGQPPVMRRLPLLLVSTQALPADGAALSLALPLPDRDERIAHWQQALPASAASAALPLLADAARLPRGQLRRLAQLAVAQARLDGRTQVSTADVQQARHSLPCAGLDALAMRLPPLAASPALDDDTRDELDALAARCRHRERLAAADGGSSGVRALFTGASGTGKTMAARALAARLQRECWRVDLAATVDKYIGETEKRLDRIFSAAEALDIVLLLDEGDALMAPRTEVASSNDRFANLETNFLLQRIESYDGIVVITSNAGDRIDRAFARRMDVTIAFRPPDEWLRYDILKLQLADGEADAIDDDWLQQLACRCALSGAQLKRVVGHARLLALQSQSTLATTHLQAALVREYRQRGAICPLREAG